MCGRNYYSNEIGGYLATIHLLESCHKNIGCITGPSSEYGAKRRLAGYRQALEEYKIRYRPEYIYEGDYLYASGEKGAEKLLEADEITAIFASNDMMAIGAINYMEKNGIKVPEDISLVGFDNNPMLDMMHIPLTTIEQPYGIMGRKAFEVLLWHIEDSCDNHKDYYFTPTLITRKSVSPPKHS